MKFIKRLGDGSLAMEGNQIVDNAANIATDTEAQKWAQEFAQVLYTNISWSFAAH